MKRQIILTIVLASGPFGPACSSESEPSSTADGDRAANGGGSASRGGGAGASAASTSQSAGGSGGASGRGNAGQGGSSSAAGGAAGAGDGATGMGGAAKPSTGKGGSGGGGARSGGAGAGGRGGAVGMGGKSGRGCADSPAQGGQAAGSGGATAPVGKGGGAGTDPTCSGPIGTFTGDLADGIAFMDEKGERVNAHGGGIIKEGETYYMHGEYFSSTTTDNNFNGFSMYSSKDLATWTWERMILPQQASGLLGPNRKGERPHIIKCPSTGEFVLYAHAASADYQTDREVVYATSSTVNGEYVFAGALTNASGQTAAHSDMSAFADTNQAYVLTESGHVYTLAADCHSWVSDKAYGAVNGDSGGSESPTVFKAGSTYYWIGSYKTGWRANNNFYSTATAMTGPWTYQGFIAPVKDAADKISDERTWLSQSTWVTPVSGCKGTVYVFWGDHWDGTQDTTAPGKHNNLATYMFQPLVFNGTAISMPEYLSTWKLDVGAGTWSK